MVRFAMVLAYLVLSAAISSAQDYSTDALLRLAAARQQVLSESETLPMPKPETPKKPSLLSYQDAMREGLAAGKRVVVIVGDATVTKGGTATEITAQMFGDDIIVCRTDSLAEYPARCIVISEPNPARQWMAYKATLPTGSSVSTVLSGIEGRVGQTAAPFSAAANPRAFRAAGEAAEANPFISREEKDAIVKAWPKNLTFPRRMQMYRMSARYQHLWTENNGSFKGWAAQPLDYTDIIVTEPEAHEFRVSGGMANVSHEDYQSVKGIDVPDGEYIDVWAEDTDVRAFADVPRWRWQFPEGTVAYDILLNADGQPFEIRTQEKVGTGWMTKVVHRERTLFPKGYTGLSQACASCHSSAGAVMSIPGRTYQRVRWGDDGRFSWRPFDLRGRLDTRWPIRQLSAPK